MPAAAAARSAASAKRSLGPRSPVGSVRFSVSTCNARLAGVPGSGSNPKTATPALSAAIAPLVMLRPPPDSASFRKMMARTEQIVPFGVEVSPSLNSRSPAPLVRDGGRNRGWTGPADGWILVRLILGSGQGAGPTDHHPSAAER